MSRAWVGKPSASSIPGDANKEEEEKTDMKTIRFLVVRAFLLIGFIISYLYLLYGREPLDGVPIPRNAAWNDLVIQIDPTTDESSKETFGKEVVLIQKFLTEHQSEVTVRIYDITLFRAIDQARARLRKADTDLETISNEIVIQGRPSAAREMIHGTGNNRQLQQPIIPADSFVVCPP
jgi:hypothetical protein